MQTNPDFDRGFVLVVRSFALRDSRGRLSPSRVF